MEAGSDVWFSAIAQSFIVMLLPGVNIISSALELEFKYTISGSLRMVNAIVHVLFLALCFTIGITVYGAIDHNATTATKCSVNQPFWWNITFVVGALCILLTRAYDLYRCSAAYRNSDHFGAW